MNQQKSKHFNDHLRERTMKMTLDVRDVIRKAKITYLDNFIANQLLRSSTSVAANYRAANRGRSDAEFYSKICIVVEEADETYFWLEYLIRVKILKADELKSLLDEVDQLIRIFVCIKNKMKTKLN